MEFIKSKLYGGEVNIVFTGFRYFFISDWYGFFAVAERDEERTNTYETSFKIYISDGAIQGGTPSEFFSFALSVIKKNENKYVERKVAAEAVPVDMHKWSIRIELVKG